MLFRSEVENLRSGAAVDALLAAEASFPGRPEWLALRGKVGAALRLGAQGALKQDDVDGVTKALTALSRFAPRRPPRCAALWHDRDALRHARERGRDTGALADAGVADVCLSPELGVSSS